MWIDPKTGAVAKLHADIRALRPDWSGPNVMTDDMIKDLGFEQVTSTTADYNPLTQSLTELAPALVGGVWTQLWRVNALAAGAAQANLQAAKAAAWVRISERRDTREEQGFQLAGHWFHSDAKSQVKYLGLKDKARDLLAAGGTMLDTVKEQGQNILWHTLDNADVPVTAQLAFDLVAAVATLQATLFVLAKQHRAGMEAVARPDLYDFSAGWPDTYQGA